MAVRSLRKTRAPAAQKASPAVTGKVTPDAAVAGQRVSAWLSSQLILWQHRGQLGALDSYLAKTPAERKAVGVLVQYRPFADAVQAAAVILRHDPARPAAAPAPGPALEVLAGCGDGPAETSDEAAERHLKAFNDAHDAEAGMEPGPEPVPAATAAQEPQSVTDTAVFASLGELVDATAGHLAAFQAAQDAEGSRQDEGEPEDIPGPVEPVSPAQPAAPGPGTPHQDDTPDETREECSR